RDFAPLARAGCYVTVVGQGVRRFSRTPRPTGCGYPAGLGTVRPNGEAARKSVRIRRGPATVTGAIREPGTPLHRVPTTWGEDPGVELSRDPAAVDLRHRPAVRTGQRCRLPAR